MKKILCTKNIKSKYFENENNIMYFDIETTGFSRERNIVYLIGAVVKNNDKYEVHQWFADSIESEKEVLESFHDFTKKYNILVSYNGESFDIPFINARLAKYSHATLDNYTSLDIYKKIKPFRHSLKLIDLRQKSIEIFLDISRDDKADGGELIEVYSEYLQTKSEDLYKLLMLHNYDDICGLVDVSQILLYSDVFNGKFDLDNDYYDKTEDELIFKCNLKAYVPKPITIHKDGIFIKIYCNKIKFLIPIFKGELKFYYENYKEYYYLPDEDMAIHKSVAMYVDKNHKEKAKRCNCYTKKNSLFLPQYNKEFMPELKNNYNDHIGFFDITNIQEIDKEKLLLYLKNIVLYVNKK